MTAKNRKLLTASFSVILVVILLLTSSITASAYTYLQFPISVSVINSSNTPFEYISINGFTNGAEVTYEDLGTYNFDAPLGVYVVSFDDDGSLLLTEDGSASSVRFSNHTGIPTGRYYLSIALELESESGAIISPLGSYEGQAYGESTELGVSVVCYYNTGTTFYIADNPSTQTLSYNIAYILSPIESSGDTPTDCPTLEEQIANYNGTWTEFLMMLRQNNRTLANSYQNNIDLAIQSGFQNGKEQGFNEGFNAGFSEGHTEGYAEGFNAGLNGGANRDPIDQYWNSTKDFILIAGQPYFAPNGFGSIDQYNTVGIYGEHESKLHRADGTTRTFNGQFVTQFASAGTLGGGWYKIGSTVGDVNAYEQSLTVQANDKAYYVARVSPLGDPVEEFLVAIWVDGYEAWYVADEFAHHGTVANNNKSYKQVYSIYMTDISPTAQRFVNYDNPTLHETFNEDINATLYLATFNQLNNYNVYTDDIGIVESYNNGFDAGANTTLWTDLISQPVVAFFSIPLAQVIVEGVTYTLTYGIVLGAGIVGLIVIWFLKLFAGG